MKLHQGIFLTLEGGEGSGKSTVAKILADWFRRQGLQVLLTREPGGVPVAERIRELIVNNEMEAMTETLLFAASRNEITKQVIEPALARGEIVICDRFVDSSFVYQGIVKNLGVELVYQINRPVLERVEPDLTFLLDINPLVGLSRIRDNGRETNKFDRENLAFHEKVREGYLSLLKRPEIAKRIRVIPAEGTPDEVARACIEAFSEWYQKRVS